MMCPPVPEHEEDDEACVNHDISVWPWGAVLEAAGEVTQARRCIHSGARVTLPGDQVEGVADAHYRWDR